MRITADSQERHRGPDADGAITVHYALCWIFHQHPLLPSGWYFALLPPTSATGNRPESIHGA